MLDRIVVDEGHRAARVDGQLRRLESRVGDTEAFTQFRAAAQHMPMAALALSTGIVAAIS